ncbi:hypothetical protein AVEN_76505-1 [Araneus ventricosus]|uniref:Uncharacterized protein n=1 Tax=Araneus ventricosus TaxID=182803 RepID=A0A4Y2CFD2_ARAVE|nr:hypothetical protein AVEN_76505-1 [Araneus ventricosus]
MSSSLSDSGSKLRGPSQNSLCVVPKWVFNITKLNSFTQKFFNLLRTTVTWACQLLGTFCPDCHKYVPAVVAFSTGCHTGVTSALMQLGFTRKSAPALSSQARWEMSAILKPHDFLMAVLKRLI